MALVLAIYLAGAVVVGATRSIWSPDCGARLIQVQSILQHWPHWWISYPGSALDPQHQNSPLYFYEFAQHGHIYVFYSFVFALFSAECFRLFGYTGLALLPVLCGVATSAVVFGLARLLRLRFPLAPLFLCALATPIVVYSVVFWDHSITTFIAAFSLYLCLRAVVSGRPAGWFAAGLALGAGLWIHEILIPYVPALLLGAWMLRRRQPWLPNAARLLLGVALLVIPLIVVNQWVYGTPFGPHLSNNRLGSGHAFLDWFGQWYLWVPGALYTLFSWGSSNPGFTWQFYGSLQAPWPHYHDPVPLGAMSVPVWLLAAIPLAMWTGLAAAGIGSRNGKPGGTGKKAGSEAGNGPRNGAPSGVGRTGVPGWAVPLALGVTLLCGAVFVHGQMDWPEFPMEMLVSAALALPLLLWVGISVTGRWRSAWRVSLVILAAMFAGSVFVIVHMDWPHSLFYACPFLALASGCWRGFRRRSEDPGPASNEKAAAARRGVAPNSASLAPASAPAEGPDLAANGGSTVNGGPSGGDGPAGVTQSESFAAETGALLNAVAAVTAFYTAAALFNPALGGAEWGSRYLLITVPALTVFSWAAVERLIPTARPGEGVPRRQPGAKPLLAIIGLLIAMSVALQVRGFQIVAQMQGQNRKLADAIEFSPDPVVITSVWWAPLDAAPAYDKKMIFYAGDADHPAPALMQRLRRAGIRTFTLIGYTYTDLASFARESGYVPISYSTVFNLGVVRYAVP